MCCEQHVYRHQEFSRDVKWMAQTRFGHALNHFVFQNRTASGTFLDAIVGFASAADWPIGALFTVVAQAYDVDAVHEDDMMYWRDSIAPRANKDRVAARAVQQLKRWFAWLTSA